MDPPCPYCDQPEASFLRLVLIGEILRADATLLVLMADVLQQTGLVHLAEEPTALPVRRPQGRRQRRRRPSENCSCVRTSTRRVLAYGVDLHLLPSTVLHQVCGDPTRAAPANEGKKEPMA